VLGFRKAGAYKRTKRMAIILFLFQPVATPDFFLEKYYLGLEICCSLLRGQCLRPVLRVIHSARCGYFVYIKRQTSLKVS